MWVREMRSKEPIDDDRPAKRRMDVRRPGVAFSVVLVPAVVAVAVIGYVHFDIDPRQPDPNGDSFAYQALGMLILLAVFCAPFVLISICLVEGFVGAITAAVAFTVGLIAVVAVPRWAEQQIEEDPGPLSPAIHLLDPVLVMAATIVVLAIGWVIRHIAYGFRTR